jgi:hypothetical protein
LKRYTLHTYHRRRIIKIKLSVGGNLDFQDDDPITLIVDASGLTISKKGDYTYREDKWKREKKKEFVKLHIYL